MAVKNIRRKHDAIRWELDDDMWPGDFSWMDINQIAERKRSVLIFEGKRELEGMKNGQRRCLVALSQKPGVVVLIGIGQPPRAIKSFLMLFGEESWEPQVSIQDFQDIWYHEADHGYPISAATLLKDYPGYFKKMGV